MSSNVEPIDALVFIIHCIQVRSCICFILFLIYLFIFGLVLWLISQIYSYNVSKMYFMSSIATRGNHLQLNAATAFLTPLTIICQRNFKLSLEHLETLLIRSWFLWNCFGYLTTHLNEPVEHILTSLTGSVFHLFLICLLSLCLCFATGFVYICRKIWLLFQSVVSVKSVWLFSSFVRSLAFIYFWLRLSLKLTCCRF